MGSFLSRPAIVAKIGDVIAEAEKEIILVVPYIRLSETVYERLLQANNRGIEITVIYREDKLHGEEKKKFYALENVNLFYHPEIHAKCYFNEKDMIITSMNLYDYSEKYNREMGILISNPTYGRAFAYKDALEEIKAILATASLEKKSKRSLANGFCSSLLQPASDKLIACCKLVNRHFDNKTFEVIDNGDQGDIKCSHYYENIHVFLEPDFSLPIDTENGDFTIKRVAIEFSWEEEKRKAVQQAFWSPVTEHMFQGYRVFWDYYSKSLLIYSDKWKFPAWKDYNEKQRLLKFKEGIETVGTFVGKLERELR